MLNTDFVWSRSMECKQCQACGQTFTPRPQSPQQSYCSNAACQRERKRRWQRDRVQTDPDYQDNQAHAQQAWADRNPDYWREYRATHPQYVERNRQLQQARNAKLVAVQIAKMDASTQAKALQSGLYRIQPITPDGIAKMDAWIVEITVHSCESKSDDDIAKR